MKVCDLQGYVTNDTVASTLLSLASLTLGKASCHVIRTIKQPYKDIHVVKNWGILPTASTPSPGTRGNHRGHGPSSPVKQLGDCSLGRYLDYNLMRAPEPEPPLSDPAKPLLNSGPTETF